MWLRPLRSVQIVVLGQIGDHDYFHIGALLPDPLQHNVPVFEVQQPLTGVSDVIGAQQEVDPLHAGLLNGILQVGLCAL